MAAVITVFLGVGVLASLRTTAAAVLGALLASLAIVYRHIARPLRRLTSLLDEGGPRLDEQLAEVRGPREIMRLAEGFRATIADRDAYEERLAHQALHDPLTGLPNRTLLAERLTHSIEHEARSGRGVAVLFVDLDDFKLINDRLGHTVGDAVLCATAARLADVVRPGDTLARFGGDEFVIVGEGFRDIEAAKPFAERLLSAIEPPVVAGDATVHVTASVGIVVGDCVSRGADLLREADMAMYLAKQRSGSCFEVVDHELRAVVEPRTAIAEETVLIMPIGASA